MESKLSFESFRLTSIRTQIIVGFGLLLGLTLLIVVINFIALQNVQAGVQETVDQASRIRELSQEFENEFLLARQQERGFLDNWRGLGFDNAYERHVLSNQEHVAQARASLNELDQLIQMGAAGQFDSVARDVAGLLPALNDYEAAFQTTVDRIQVRSQANGLDARLDSTLDELESAAGGLPNSNELNRVVVEISANEQAFFSTREQQYVDQTRLLALRADELLNETAHLSWAWSELTRPGTIDLVQNHLDTFREIELLEGEIAINAAIFEEQTAVIGATTDLIREAGEVGLAQAREDLETTVIGSTILSVAFGLVALGIGILTAWFLARRIIGPLGELTEAAEQVGAGNLEYTVRTEGQDEFAALGRVFNQMAGQLNNLVGSLELLVATRTRALATSYEVSRRLSTILDQEQLVSEVVEQIRSAFDYYHAHIYLLDDNKQQLLMVGGTGEAGREMLAAGHKLAPGQGLVGRAAETRQAVLVPDVTLDPSWLPNPLLPGTRSEVAVPIMLGDQVQGVLDVQHDVQDGLDQNDVQLLQSIANQVAVALQNADLYGGAQRTADRETTVNLINQQIQQAVTIEGVLQTAARELGKALNADRTSIQVGMSRTTQPTRQILNQVGKKTDLVEVSQSKQDVGASTNNPASNGRSLTSEK